MLSPSRAPALELTESWIASDSLRAQLCAAQACGVGIGHASDEASDNIFARGLDGSLACSSGSSFASTSSARGA